jgi:hypothetical protein
MPGFQVLNILTWRGGRYLKLRAFVRELKVNCLTTHNTRALRIVPIFSACTTKCPVVHLFNASINNRHRIIMDS